MQWMFTFSLQRAFVPILAKWIPINKKFYKSSLWVIVNETNTWADDLKQLKHGQLYHLKRALQLKCS